MEQQENQVDDQPAVEPAENAERNGQLDIESVIDEAVQQASQQPPPELSNDEKVAEAQREALRAKAELENFRKRMQRESESQLKYANLPLIREMLSVVDNLNRATEAAAVDGADKSSLEEGVRMVAAQFTSVLEKFGCVMIKSLGEEFDPNFHEALGQMPSDEYAAGMVAHEVTLGYRLHDRVIRPSTVMVSTGPAETPSAS